MKKLMRSPASRLVALVTILAMTLISAQAAQAGQAAEPTRAGTTAAAERTVADTRAGTMDSRIFGETANGRRVTGAFVPLRFFRRDGKVFVRGLVQGVVHNASGSTSTFAQLKTARVKSINDTPIRVRQGATAQQAVCDILHLVLGPLDLDLLGLQVHLNRVVLDIVAVSGPGNLLGNLLCAIAGLLDGGLGGVLGRLVGLLNQVLARLRLG